MQKYITKAQVSEKKGLIKTWVSETENIWQKHDYHKW